MKSKMTESGKLFHGVEVDGMAHVDFELRLPTVADNIEAVEEVGSHNALAVSAAVLARQVLKLGTLSQEEITYGLMCDLHPSDYNILEAAAESLEKKFKAARAAALNSSEPASPSSVAA